MPAILRQKHEDLWLQPDPPTKEDLGQILTPYPSDLMEAYPVSAAVNSPDNDTEELIKPLPHL
jgi:putative SOS response-associated peptidase YedK